MAQYYLLPKALAKRAPWTRKPVWLFEAAILLSLIKLVRLLSFPVAASFLASLFGAVGYRNSKKRALVAQNMRFVRPQASEAELKQLVKEVFRTTGLAAAELFLQDKIWRHRDKYLEFSVDPQAKAIMDKGEPVVYATAHAGAWQYTILISKAYDLDISVIYAKEANPWVHDYFLKLRSRFGARMVPSEGGLRAFIKELSLGHSVGAAFDTRLDQGELIPLFGVDAPTNTVPGRLSLAGNHLIPTRCVRLPGCRYRIEVMAPLQPEDPSADRKEKTRNLALQLNRLFEQWIDEDPGQWLCLKRRWPKDAQPALSSEGPRVGRGKRSAPAE